MVFDKVKEIVSRELSVSQDKLTLDTRLSEDLGADSLDAVELIMALEDEFGVSISDDAAQGIKKLSDIVNYLEQTK